MKLKKSLMAITTATAVAISGTAVASAQDTTGSLENITEGGLTGSIGGNEETTDPATGEGTETPAPGTEEGEATGSADFFGWDEETSGLDKLETISTVFGVIVTVVGGIATLVGAVMKINDMLAPKN
ncbi:MULTISPECIES: hypothetical protein [Corynebacterium]|uniref:hypothetical protein n=1 Tax=Corynebacterium TaxID=1716 RepID=UPI001178BEE1|nr:MULTISPECIES: hypothetical protein [Corynebacterium]MBF0581426.1 hypothetical protein [Corynebacterium sp. ED61]